MENYLAGTIIVRYIYILPLLYCRAGVKPRDALCWASIVLMKS